MEEMQSEVLEARNKYRHGYLHQEMSGFYCGVTGYLHTPAPTKELDGSKQSSLSHGHPVCQEFEGSLAEALLWVFS